MSKLSKKSKETLELMKGCEVLSLNYEGCVYISGSGEVFMDGEIVDTLNTTRKVNKLWKEYLEGEGIC